MNLLASHTHSSLARSCLLASFLAAAALAASAGPQQAPAWVPNETLVSPQFDLLDPEYSQSRARITWVDSVGSLWIAAIDRDTGMFLPTNGKGVLVDPDAMATGDLQIIGNGPEWLMSNRPDQIVYTKFLPGRAHTRENARLALAAQRSDGSWGYQMLGDLPRNAPYASKDAGDAAPRISYVDRLGNHYWREVSPRSTENLVADYPQSYYSMRFVQGQRATVFLAPDANGQKQVFRYWLDSQALEQITTDSRHESTSNVPWMWAAPEFGNQVLMATLTDNDTVLSVYKQTDASIPAWSVIYTATAPGGGTLGSPEPFVYGGKSYLFMHATVGSEINASRILLSNVDAANPMMRQLTPDLPLRTRRDPEVFITSSGPKMYYNRFRPSLTWCIPCSEGIFMSDSGLGPPAP